MTFLSFAQFKKRIPHTLIFFPTVDEDFQYFRSKGYTGSLNDMHYNAFGDLGYTGSLNDRIHKYMTEKYGSFYEAMRDLRNGTSVFALTPDSSSYAVNGFDPSLVFDFEQNYYRTGGTETTLNPAVTHSRAGQATMTDSDGKIKWAPHNLVTYSEDFSNSSWLKSSCGVNANVVVAPDGSTTADEIIPDTTTIFVRKDGPNSSLLHTASVWIKDAGRGACFVSMGRNTKGYLINVDLTDGSYISGRSYGGGVLSSYSITSGGNGWYRVSVSATEPTSGHVGLSIGGGDGVSSASGFYIWGAHVYRSDLGGMVNNPAQSTGFETYVPTTSAAVYLPRVGHHIYNGSAWINEGVLHESEARTNLLTYSEDFTSWSTVASTLTNTGSTAPDGSTSWRLTDNGQTFIHGAHLENAFTVSGGFTTWSVMCRAGTARYVAFAPKNSPIVSGVKVSVIFDLQTGVFTDTSNGPNAAYIDGYGSENLGGGWYRIYLKSDLANTGYDNIGVFISTDGLYANLSYTGTGEYIDFALAQIEAGATPSSYIPTSGSTVTRAAETLTVPAANLPYDSTNMSIQIDGKITYADTNNTFEMMWWEWKLSSSDNMKIHLSTSGGSTGLPTFTQKRSVTDNPIGVPNNVYSPGIDVPFNLASRHGSTFINGATEGTSYTVNTTPTSLPDLSATDLTLGTIFMGTIGKFRMWSEDLTDTGIEEAST